MVKNLPANAGDTGSIPISRKSHMPQSNSASVPQLLSLHSSLWSVTTEANAMRSPHTGTGEEPQLEKSLSSNKDPAQPKLNN